MARTRFHWSFASIPRIKSVTTSGAAGEFGAIRPSAVAIAMSDGDQPVSSDLLYAEIKAGTAAAAGGPIAPSPCTAALSRSDSAHDTRSNSIGDSDLPALRAAVSRSNSLPSLCEYAIDRSTFSGEIRATNATIAA